MSPTATQAQTLLLAQIAAESYLDGISFSDAALLGQRLRLGSNRFSIFENPEATSRAAQLDGQTRMTDAQVTEFSARYEVRDHLPNTITGFSGTLLWDRIDSRYVLSFRSLEYADQNKGGDWARDGLNGAAGEIGNYGFAVAQIGDMEAYFRHLQSQGKLPSGANYSVTGYSLGGHLATVFAQAHAGDAGFQGAVTFNGAGHGTLANGAVSDFVTAVYACLQAAGLLLQLGAGADPNNPPSVYRTAAYDGLGGGNTDVGGILGDILSQFQPVSRSLSSLPQPLSGNITQVYGLADTGDSFWVANSGVHSNSKVELFIEDQPDIQGFGVGWFDSLFGSSMKSDFGTTHSITLLADTLAVVKLLHQLQPQLAPEAIRTLLSAGSNERGIGLIGSKGLAESGSLETPVETLAAIFKIDIAALAASMNGGQIDGKLPRDDGGGGFGNLTFRNIFHAALKEIGDAAGIAGGYTIEVLAGRRIEDVVSAAEGADSRSLAYRYALRTGSAFVLIGPPYQQLHNTNGELDLYDPASRSGTLTRDWIRDRAAYLERINYYNANNARYDLTTSAENPGALGDATATQFDGEDLVWQDLAASITIRRGADTGVTALRVFGSDGADGLAGGRNADHLYGAAGTDYLRGRGGADRLEGGVGLDVYEYHSARPGFFTTSADGHDTVVDVDGKGALHYLYLDAENKVQSTILGGVAIRQAAGIWLAFDGRFTLTPAGADLRLSFSPGIDGSVTFKDFDFDRAAQSGYLGVRLVEQATEPETAAFVNGDQQDDKVDVLYGARPDAEVPPAAAGERIDAGLDNDIIYADRNSGEANASLFGNADWVIGGEGRDSIEAGAGNDLVEAGGDGIANGDPGGDIVDAGAGDDEVYAGVKTTLADAILEAGDLSLASSEKGDFLSGGEGEDWLIGERGNDLLMGGRGRDLIVGGAGDDNIYGDWARAANTLEWTATRTTPVFEGVLRYVLEIGGSPNVAEGLGEGDTIYAGSGADWVFAGAGDDVVDAGAGADVIFGGAGDDAIAGGQGDDVLAGDDGAGSAASGNDVIDGGDGSDVIHGNGGDDVLIGGNGDDTLAGNEGADVLIGGAGKDGLIGGAGRDTYIFNRHDGVEEIFDLDDQLRDAAGNPIAPGADRSVIVFGEGVARSDIKFRPGSLLIDLGQGDSIRLTTLFSGDPSANVAIDRLEFADGSVMMHSEILAQGFEIDGTDAAEVILGTAVSDRIDTRKGNDLAIGNAGADAYTFNLGDGQDTLEETTGGNVVRFGAGIASGDLQVTPWTGFDGRGAFGEYLRVTYKIYPFGGGGRLDPPPPPPDELFLRGGLQGNFARYDFADGTALIHAELMQRSGSVSIAGTEADESMAGSNFADTLLGAGGDDTLFGQKGNDQLFGGEGDDVLDGQDGNDSVSGGAGDDVLDGSAGNDQLAGGEGFDLLSGGAGSDQLFGGEDDDALDGGVDDDVLHGEAGADALEGGEGDDFLFGGADADDLEGGAGADILNGDEGDDRLAGDAGDDLLQGGAGNDIYTVGAGDGVDIIRDAEGANRVLFGDGITAASLVLDQYIADDGTDFLSIGYGGGTLDIVEGVRGGVAEFEFADGSVVELAQLLAGAPALVVRGTEAAEALYGSNSADELLGAGGEDTLSGQGGDDFLSGGTGADVLLGGAGDDTLAGNAGDDWLAGGAGTDTYKLGFAGGRDTIQEVAGESSVLELEAGLLPADLSAQRSGDDLVLRRRGTEEGVTVADYYVQPHAWILKDAQGATQDLADFLSGAPGNSASHADRLRALAIGQFTKLFADRGYSLRADGKFHFETTEAGFAFTKSVHRAADYAISLRTDDVSENLAAGGSYTSTLASRTETQTEIVMRNVISEIRFNPRSVNHDPQTTPNFYPSGIGLSGLQVPLGSTMVQVNNAQGSVQGYWIYPEGTAPSGGAAEIGTPGVTTIIATTIREEYAEHLQLDELAAGDGANTITVSGNAIVDAGGGDDLILGAFDNAYWSTSRVDYESNPGLFGNELRLGSEFLFGGNGADTMYGGVWADVLAGGEGHDRLYGQGGADVYYMDASDAGIDYVQDEGGIAQVYGGRVEGSLSELGHFESWYYQRIGYVDDGTAPRPALPYANDFAAWEPAYGTSLINPDVVRFGPGIRPQDLTLSWGEVQFLGFKHATLNIRWAADKGVDIFIPRGDDTIGSGIELFEFDDGTRLTMREMIARAPAHEYQYQNLALGDGDDMFAGRSVDETVRGGAGNDTLGSVGMSALYEHWSHYTHPARSGNDTFYGEAGDDVLDGGDGLDLLYGGEGADTLSDRANGFTAFITQGGLLDGGSGADSLLLRGGDGFAAGGTGNDAVDLTGTHGAVYAFNRGDGADVLSVGNVTTISLGGGIAPGDVQISSSGDELLLELGAGDSILLGGAPENFRLQFFGPEVRLQDLAGTELFVSSTSAVGGQLAYDYATFGSNAFMTAAETRAALAVGMLEASAFARRVAGTPGDDVLSGGTGDDVFHPSGGVDSIVDAGGTDTIVFGEGTSEGDLSLGLGSLTIRLGDGAVIHLPNFDPQDPFGAHDIERFRFADGTELSYSQLISRGFDLLGSDTGESIAGTTTTDRIDGRGGDDLLAGGYGSDTYFFGPGSGNDRIAEAFSLADTDVLRVAATPQAVEVTRAGDDLVLALTQGGDQVAVRWFTDPGARIERVQFSDGTLWDAATFEAQAGGENTPPVVASPVADQSANEDEAYTFVLPEGTFYDPGDTLLLAASLENGVPLPAWLAFDAASRTFSGTPGNADVGTVRIHLIATDAAGASGIDSFDMVIANVNDAPFTTDAIADISVVEGQPVHYTVAAGLFADEDTGDTLAYGMRLAGGGELPDWLAFNSATRTLSGTTPMGQAGTVRLAATATDSHGEEAFLEFNVAFTVLPPQEIEGTSGDDVLYGGSGNDTILVRGGSDYANGGQGDDLVRGGNGSDILQGSGGDDVVRGGNGQDLLDGGAGADEVRGGALSDFAAGGTGDDVLRTGGGSDVIGFNRGDGWDLVHSDAGQNNTLSLGGGIRYEDVSLRKAGHDLVVDLGSGDALTLKGWYGAASRESLATLQFIGESSSASLVSSFDFLGIANAFDAARAANPGLTAWSITQAMTQFHLASSDSEALGGDLASYYAQMGSFTGLSLAAARDTATAASFGQQAQALRPLSGLQEGLVKLSA